MKINVSEKQSSESKKQTPRIGIDDVIIFRPLSLGKTIAFVRSQMLHGANDEVTALATNQNFKSESEPLSLAAPVTIAPNTQINHVHRIRENTTNARVDGLRGLARRTLRPTPRQIAAAASVRNCIMIRSDGVPVPSPTVYS